MPRTGSGPIYLVAESCLDSPSAISLSRRVAPPKKKNFQCTMSATPVHLARCVCFCCLKCRLGNCNCSFVLEFAFIRMSRASWRFIAGDDTR